MGARGFEDFDESDILEVAQPGTDSLSAGETKNILLLDIAEKTSEQAIEISVAENNFHSHSLKKVLIFYKKLSMWLCQQTLYNDS